MPSPKLDDSVCVFVSDGLLNIQHRLLFLLSPLHKAGPDDHSVLAGSAFAEFGTLGKKGFANQICCHIIKRRFKLWFEPEMGNDCILQCKIQAKLNK